MGVDIIPSLSLEDHIRRLEKEMIYILVTVKTAFKYIRRSEKYFAAYNILRACITSLVTSLVSWIFRLG